MVAADTVVAAAALGRSQYSSALRRLGVYPYGHPRSHRGEAARVVDDGREGVMSITTRNRWKV
jgi:hypothetical protein